MRLIEFIFGIAIASIIAAWFVMWYNYLWIQYPLDFLQCWVIGLAMWGSYTLAGKPIQSVWAILFGASIIVQVLNWVALVALPVFNLAN